MKVKTSVSTFTNVSQADAVNRHAPLLPPFLMALEGVFGGKTISCG
jgi:hypothetical protein